MPVPTQKEKEIYELQKKYQRLDKQLKRLYGIGIEQYNQMWQGQDGLCAICGQLLSTPCLFAFCCSETYINHLCIFCLNNT